MTSKSLTRSFAGGELTEQLFGRLDLGKYQTGVAKAINFLVTPQGPLVNRPGLEFVRATKNNGVARLIPFTYSSTQTLIIEIGAGYFRFHTDAATVLSGGVPYEVVNSYTAAELFDIHYVQSADVLTLVHPSHAPAELRRLSATNWVLSTISFVPTITAPVSASVVAVGTGGTPTVHTYVATSVAQDTLEESLASVEGGATVDLNVAGNYVSIQLTPVVGAVRYNIYKQISGLFGYIGQTDGSEFSDTNITPDITQTPQLINEPFAVGAITSVTVTAPGSLYGSTPYTGGVINNVTVTAGGSAYTTPTATAAGGGTGAVLTPVVGAGVVTSVTITNGGVGYLSPTVTIAGPPGSGATATATATARVSVPAVALTITDPTGTGCTLAPVVIGGAMTGVRVVQQGHGYTAPVVSVTQAQGGSGATFAVPVYTTSTGVNPGAVSYFEQRRVFAGSTDKPQTIWATRSGTESNMGYSIPSRSDDSITARIAAREANTIRHLVPLNDLLALTSAGAWRIVSSNSDVLTPSNISAKQQGGVGANNAQPILTSKSILYAQARGSRVRELSYSWQLQGYDSIDVSILAPHLFDYQTIVQLAYSGSPTQILWAVRGDGVLLGMTYAPEHEVKAWHRHTTKGYFESVAVVAEVEEDAVYVVVRRTIGGSTVRYIERMHSRNFAALEDSFFVDSGLTYSGGAATIISGMGHLEGQTVAILADGGVEPQQVVTAGAVTLTAAASKVHIGLPYDCDAQGMPLSMEAALGAGQGDPKNISLAWLRIYQSSSIKAGPSFDRLREYRQRTPATNYGLPPPLVTGLLPIGLPPNWSQDAQWCVRQSDPLPLTLLAITLEFAVGG